VPVAISSILDGKSDLIATTRDESLKTVLDKMDQFDYSQLPVVDGGGKLEGIVTIESVLRSTRIFGTSADELRVQDATIPARAYREDDDLFEVLEGLATEFAVIILDGERRPVGIVTNFDTSRYFRQRAEDTMLVEDIEGNLRDYIAMAFRPALSEEERVRFHSAVKSAVVNAPEIDKFKEALTEYTGESEVDQQKLENAYTKLNSTEKVKKSFDDLTFQECMNMFLAKERWAQYSQSIAIEKGAVRRMLDTVRKIRNKLAHFRGEVTGSEHEALLMCRGWLETNKSATQATFDRIIPPLAPSKPAVELLPNAREESTEKDVSKYAPFARWLRSLPPDLQSTIVPFRDFEVLIGSELPPFAWQHRSWWANDTTTRVQSRAWLSAGFRVGAVDMEMSVARFDRFALPGKSLD